MSLVNKVYLMLPKRVRLGLRDSVKRMFNQIPRYDCQMVEALLRIKYTVEAGTDFHGEFLQDLAAYMYFKGKRDGFYVDIGANDGISGSNTLVFEKLGWKGFCVEPHPEVYQVLRKNRACDAYEIALADEGGGVVNFAKFIGTDCRSKYSGTDISAVKERSGGLPFEIISVKTATFNELMAHYPNVRHIDFLSIDVEGGELSILKAIDFERFSFGLFMIEDNSPALVEFMASKGYRIFERIVRDYMFVKESHI